DGLAGVTGHVRVTYGHCGRRAARDPRQDALLAREAARVLERLLVRHLLDGVDQRQVEHLRHEARAEALDLVRARLQRLAAARLREHRAPARLDRDRLDLPAARVLDVARDAGDRAARADAAHQDVDRAVGVVPDLGAGRGFVDRRVGRVG